MKSGAMLICEAISLMYKAMNRGTRVQPSRENAMAVDDELLQLAKRRERDFFYALPLSQRLLASKRDSALESTKFKVAHIWPVPHEAGERTAKFTQLTVRAAYDHARLR